MAVVPEGVAGIAHIAYDLPLLHHVAYVHRLADMWAYSVWYPLPWSIFT